MSTQQVIEQKLRDAFQPMTLNVENESHMHSVPANSETHFKVTLVSDQFNGMPRVRRHQSIYKILAEELAHGVHALALHLYSPQEWSSRESAVPDSPNCMGGSKRDPAHQS